MAAFKVMDSYPPFEYGSAVRWKASEGELVEGSICGFTIVASDKQAATTGLQIGAVLVLIERRTGETIEAPLTELELI